MSILKKSARVLFLAIIVFTITACTKEQSRIDNDINIIKENAEADIIDIKLKFRDENNNLADEKRIINEDIYLSPEKKDKIIRKKKHSIEGLWNSVETVMQDGGMNVDANDLNNFRILAASLHKYDQGSSKFRYPCDKDADLFFGKKEVLDINNVEDVFTDFTSTLNGIHQILDEIKTNSYGSKGLTLTP